MQSIKKSCDYCKNINKIIKFSAKPPKPIIKSDSSEEDNEKDFEDPEDIKGFL